MVAPLVAYLCTDAAANVNGRDFVVGGDEVSLMTIPSKQATIYRDGGWDLASLERVFPRVIGCRTDEPGATAATEHRQLAGARGQALP